MLSYHKRYSPDVFSVHRIFQVTAFGDLNGWNDSL